MKIKKFGGSENTSFLYKVMDSPRTYIRTTLCRFTVSSDVSSFFLRETERGVGDEGEGKDRVRDVDNCHTEQRRSEEDT